MKTLHKLPLLLLLCVAACTHKSTNPPLTGDYMIIGHPGAFTNTPRLTFYLLAHNTLMRDTSVLYAQVPDDNSKFSFTIPATAAQYDAVKTLLSGIPAELLGKNNQHIGQLFPDAGYTDVRVTIGGTAYRWYFEGDRSGCSAAVQQFVTQAEQVFK